MEIGALGLDTKDIEAALDRVGKKLGQTAAQTEGLNMAVTAAGAAIAIWASNVVAAKDRAEQLDKAIEGVARSLSAAEFNTESGLETRLKEVDALLTKIQGKKPLSDVIIEGVSDFFTGKDRSKEEDETSTMAVKKRQEIEEQLAAKIEQQTQLMRLRRMGLEKEADILQAQIKYDEMRVKLAGSMTSARQEALKIQEKELLASIEQKHNEDAMAAAKKETDKIQKENDKEAEAEVKRAADEEAEDQAHLLKTERDRRAEAVKAARDAVDAAKKLAEEEKKRLAFNEKIADELRAQTREMKAALGGNQTAAKREAMENDYDEKIKDAVRRGDTASEIHLKAQRQMERDDLDIEESQKTPRQRAEERKIDRKRKSDKAKADARNAELERRSERGAKSAQIEDRDKVGTDQKDRAGGVERVRRQGQTPASKGFDEKAAKDLADIAAAFRNKGQ